MLYLKNKAEETRQGKSFVKTYYRFEPIDTTDKAITIASLSTSALCIALLGLLVLLFTGLAAGAWLGKWFSSPAAGYLVVAGFFSVLAVVFLLLRKKVIFPFLRNFIIRKLYE
jgi:hypothetical protein